MNGREMFAIAPICVLCLAIGVMPQPLLKTIQPDVDAVVALYDANATVTGGVSDSKLVADVARLQNSAEFLRIQLQSSPNPQPPAPALHP